jgi:CHAD domain-containing protein
VESIHQLRVASRRLASQLFLLDSVLPGPRSQKAGRIVKRQLQSLGGLRDLHILRIFIDQQTARFSELTFLQHRLARQERELTKPASRRINRSKTYKLERWIDRLLADLTRASVDTAARGRFTAKALRCAEEAFAETVQRWRLIDRADLRTIHRTRVAFKKFRYIVECLSPEIAGLSRRQLRRLAYYQRKMGNIQDLHVIQEAITGVAREDKGLERLLHPFSAYLRRRKSRALRSFLKSADKLLEFWPPPGLRAAGQSPSIQRSA